MVDAGELSKMELKSELTKQAGLVDQTLTTWEDKTKQWVTEYLAAQLQSMFKSYAEQAAEMAAMREQMKDLLTMQGTLMRQVDALMAESDEEAEGEGSGEPSAPPYPTESRSVQDSVQLAMQPHGDEPFKSVKAEKGIDHGDETKGEQPGPSGAGVLQIHRMVHTAAGGVTEQSAGAGEEDRERYSTLRGRAYSPELGIGQMKLEPPSRYNGAKRPGVGKWIDAMTTWMSLMNYPTSKWVLIASTRLEGHALSWYTAHAWSVQEGTGRD